MGGVLFLLLETPDSEDLVNIHMDRISHACLTLWQQKKHNGWYFGSIERLGNIDTASLWEELL